MDPKIDSDGVTWRVVPYGAMASIKQLKTLKRQGVIMSPTQYWASSDGRLRKVLADGITIVDKEIWTHPNGYRYTALKGRHRFVHRTICWAFHGEPLKLDMRVNHRNGVKGDNRPENLEWTTVSENIQHAWDTGLCDTEQHRASVLRRSKRVVVCWPDGDQEYTSLRAAAEALGMKGSNLHEQMRAGRSVDGKAVRYADGFEMVTRPPSNIEGDRRAQRVARLDDNGRIAEVFAGISIAAKSVGKSRKTLWHAVVNKATCGGFMWKRVGRDAPIGVYGENAS